MKIRLIGTHLSTLPIIPLTVVAFSPIFVLPRILLHFATKDHCWKDPGPVPMQTLVQGMQKITGSLTQQSREEERHTKTQKKRYPGVLGTPDEYWCPLSSDCDRHADGTSA